MRNININPIIETGFTNFVVDGVTIPIEYRRYKGKATTYLEYYTWSTKAEEFADDAPQEWGIYGTMDIYSKGNFKNVLTKVIEKLEELNFTVTDIEIEDYDDETQYYHVPVNFYKEGGN